MKRPFTLRFALALLIALSFGAGAKEEMTVFDLAQKLLDARANIAKVEEITGLKMSAREHDENFNRYEISASKGPFTRFELRVPKSRGGTLMIIDLREHPAKREILARFGRAKVPEYESGGKRLLAQEYKEQTLTWVLDDQGRAERLLIIDGR
jgi:hypothetical protein